SVGPVLKIAGKLVVGDDINSFKSRNRSEVVEEPFDDRLPGDFEKRFRLVQGEGIKPRRVTGSEDERVHSNFRGRYAADSGAPVILKLSSGSAQNGRAQTMLKRRDPIGIGNFSAGRAVGQVKGIDRRAFLGANARECNVRAFLSEGGQQIIE